MSQEFSDRFRHVLADQFSGLSFTEACERSGTTVQAFSNLTAKYSDQWALCQQEIQEAVLNNVALNAWISRSLLSDVGPHAVRTLYDLMTDKAVTPSVREKAAKDVLDLIDVGGKAHLGARLEETAARFADLAEIAADNAEAINVVPAEADNDVGMGNPTK